MTKTNAEKAVKHEQKGDELALKGKHARALKEYRKALELDPEKAGLYDKLISTRDLIPDDWSREDFAESMDWVMKKQEREHPPLKQTHAKLSPEWAQATSMAIGILTEEDEEKRAGMTEDFVAMGEVATRAMIGLLLDLKKIPPPEADQEKEKEKEEEKEE